MNKVLSTLAVMFVSAAAFCQQKPLDSNFIFLGLENERTNIEDSK